ncbi:3-isopropylmalate dehydratase large subunit [Patescibacteria group bacterium]|nr:3-isopropylmalate dehydratase large subunit [Patescibacteria group bacterium]
MTNKKPKNIIEKIWNAHVVHVQDGHPDIFAIDLQLIHEVTSPQAFDELRKHGQKFYAPNRCIATIDHNVSTEVDRIKGGTIASRFQMKKLRNNCNEFGVKLFDVGSGKQGIIHVIGPELGLTQPGMTIVCGDSHTSTHGAFGAIAFGIGSTEVSHVMATGCLLQKKPKTMRVHFVGSRGKGITAKDLILKLIQVIGIAGATGFILEYTGKVIRNLNMEERMTICNMSIECGARAGLIAPDETTFEYIRSRPGAPEGKYWSKAVKHWRSLVSDEGADFDQEVEIDISNMTPLVTWGINPALSVEIDENIPKLTKLVANELDLAKIAFKYTKLKPGQLMDGVPIDYVFIGSCTNARITDLRAAAKIMKGKTVANGVKVYVVPGSETVRDQSIKEGLDKVFIEAGADFRQPGCSMCLAMNDDKVPKGKRCASTSNRNFIGRQGPGSITHLMSPIMAAAAAIEGKIVDVRNYL